MVVTEGGVTKACKKLLLTQPTISAQIKALEIEIGKPLFERTSRRMIMTETGRIVFEHADSMFKKGSDLYRTIKTTSSGSIIEIVKIGVAIDLPRKIVHNTLRHTLKSNVHALELISKNDRELVDGILNQEIQFAITENPADHRDVASHMIEQAAIVCAVSYDDRALKRTFPKCLNDLALYLPSHSHTLRAQFETFMTTHSIMPRIKASIDDWELLRVIAAGGDGIVFIPRSAISDLIKTKMVAVIDNGLNITQPYYLVTHARYTPHPLATKIITDSTLGNR